jgi:5-methylcytosine-specific restriction endonuclease McrBC regulatory subunit McrC
MGFVGRNNTQLTISSRFYPQGNDYFLHYMLQKVFAINIINFDQTKDNENIWDFLLYLFPYYLQKAYAQGLYKAYRREEYNDANVKGTIDVKRHIRINNPFAGKIAYTTREHSYDNPVTQLIRHTIEHIKVHPWGSSILTNDSETRDIVSKICFVTQNHYNKNERQKVINTNLKPVLHPYFTEYKMLQKICLRILRHEKLTFGEQKDKIYGLLFDGAWLWEEYLNTLLKNYGFTHAENKTGKNSIYLFQPHNYKRFPDFYKSHFVLDAKYKNLDEKQIDRNDIHQIISYMYVQKAELGGFVNPVKDNPNTNPTVIGQLHGYGGNVKLWKLYIPQNARNFSEFHNKMKESADGMANRTLTASHDP